MIPSGRVTRRQALLLAATALGSLPLRIAAAAPSDQGIGGTGFSVRPDDEASDRGIGGTGVIGTIRKFGSIIVNDLRIAYQQTATVRIDGQPATVADLKLGQVVRVAAASDGKGGLSTQLIDVTSEVVGPVERTTAKGLTVLGQNVSTAELKGSRTWRVGDHVAVSGVRRNDGTVVASLIEPRDGSLTKVAGPVTQAPSGELRIGALNLVGADGTLIGQRAVVEGRAEGAGLTVTRATNETALLPRDIRTLSVEAYVERRGSNLRLGSGLLVAHPGTTSFPAGRSVRAVLTTTVARDGQLGVESIREGNRQYRAPGGQQERRVPMNFERAPAPPSPRLERERPLGEPFGAPGGGFGRGGFGGGGFGGGRR